MAFLPNYGRQIVQGQKKGKVGRDERQRSVRSYKGIGYPLKGGKKVRPSLRIRSGYYFSSSGLRCQCEVYTLRESGQRCSAGLRRLEETSSLDVIHKFSQLQSHMAIGNLFCTLHFRQTAGSVLYGQNTGTFGNLGRKNRFLHSRYFNVIL